MTAQIKKQVSQENEERASLYWWFSTLLSKELDLQQLHIYFDGEGKQFLEHLQQQKELSLYVVKMQSSLDKLQTYKYPHLELAADFSELFLTDNKVGAPPYASVYLSKSAQLYGEPHQKMQEEFKKQGLVIDPQFNEPADHVAIQLDYLGNLIIAEAQGVSKQQIQFVEEHIMTWLNLFVKATDKVSNTGFYQALCHLLEVVLKEDFNLDK